MPGDHALEPDAPPTCHPRPAADNLAVEAGIELGAAIGVELEVDGASREVRIDAKSANVARRQRLEPNRLPDPRGRRVEDPLRPAPPELLAARDGLVFERVFGANDEHVVARPQRLCDVDAEGRVPALVASQLPIVDPHRGAIVDRTKVQGEPFSLRGVESPPVPDDIAGNLADPGELRLGAERNHDVAIEGRPRAGAEPPLAVQVDPIRAAESRTRVLGSWSSPAEQVCPSPPGGPWPPTSPRGGGD